MHSYLTAAGLSPTFLPWLRICKLHDCNLQTEPKMLGLLPGRPEKTTKSEARGLQSYAPWIYLYVPPAYMKNGEPLTKGKPWSISTADSAEDSDRWGRAEVFYVFICVHRCALRLDWSWRRVWCRVWRISFPVTLLITLIAVASIVRQGEILLPERSGGLLFLQRGCPDQSQEQNYENKSKLENFVSIDWRCCGHVHAFVAGRHHNDSDWFQHLSLFALHCVWRYRSKLPECIHRWADPPVRTHTNLSLWHSCRASAKTQLAAVGAWPWYESLVLFFTELRSKCDRLPNRRYPGPGASQPIDYALGRIVDIRWGQSPVGSPQSKLLRKWRGLHWSDCVRRTYWRF